MKATITLHDVAGAHTLTPDDIRFVLQREGVAFGILEDILDNLRESPRFEEPVVVAEALAPVHGSDSILTEKVTLTPSLRPLVLEDGSVDHKALDIMENVTADTVLMTKTPATPGSPGRSIFGKTLEARPGKDIPLPVGENTEIVLGDTGSCLVAKADGYLYKNRHGVHVRKLFYVKSNVDYSTGNVVYTGDVFVKGNVLSGFRVQTEGGDITIRGEVEGAELSTQKGSITCSRGILGKSKAVITAGGGINAQFIQDATIVCRGRLTIARTMLQVKARVGGDTIIGNQTKGTILGGELRCRGSIFTPELGNQQHTKTVVIMESERNCIIDDKINESKKKREETKHEFSACEQQLQVKSRLFKVKANKTAEDRSEVERLLKKYYELKQTTKHLDELIASLRQEAERVASYGVISVSRAIYPGVILRFGKTEKRITSALGAVTFVYQDQTISAQPYKKPETATHQGEEPEPGEEE